MFGTKCARLCRRRDSKQEVNAESNQSLIVGGTLNSYYTIVHLSYFFAVEHLGLLSLLVAWHSGRVFIFYRRTFPDLVLDLQLTGKLSYMGKPSAIGQPTQPFILLGSTNEQ